MDAAKAKRVCAYIRVSTTDQMDKYGPDVQRKRLEGYIAAHYPSAEVFWPLPDAATGKNDKRPALQWVLEHAAEFDVVVAMDLGRLARNLGVLMKVEEELRAKGCAMACVDQQVDTSTPLGKLVFHILGAMYQFDRESLVARMTEGKRAKQEKTGCAWGGKPPLGYRYAKDGKGTLVEDDYELAVVREILATPGSARLIAAHLSVNGRTGRGGKPLHYRTVERVLKNRGFYNKRKAVVR